MTIAEPLASVDEKALESEIGRTVPKLAALHFGKPRVVMANRPPRISATCCGRYRKPRWGNRQSHQ
jgi:hypothetical protein